MDRNSELGNIFRRARKFMHAGMEVRFSRPLDGFAEFAEEAVNTLYCYRLTPDDFFVSTVGEVIPRLFAIDVTTGYRFFHDPVVLNKLWEIYNIATSVVAAKVKATRTFRRQPPYRTAFVTAMFSDYIAPAKAIANFALNVDRARFEPMMELAPPTFSITTDCFQTLLSSLASARASTSVLPPAG